MRKHSKGSVMLMIVTPVMVYVLLWYVVFPAIENEPSIGLFSWSGNRGADCTEDGYADEESDLETAEGFRKMQIEETDRYAAGEVYTINNSNDVQDGSSENTGGSNTNTDDGSSTIVANNAVPVVYSNTNRLNQSVANDNYDTRHEIVKGADQLAEIVTAADKLKRAGNHVREIKNDIADQSKTKGTGNEFLSPPDEDDPEDVPLDGGLTILVTATLGYGLRKSGVFKQKTNYNKGR